MNFIQKYLIDKENYFDCYSDDVKSQIESQFKWDSRYLNLVLEVATWSKDPSTKVGAAIVSTDNRIISLGYNGFAEGVKDSPEKWDRPEKYEWIIHAELNAILNARDRDVKGAVLYCTTRPCHRCLQHIVNAGIIRIVWIRPSEDFIQRWFTGLGDKIFWQTIKDTRLGYQEYQEE